MSLLQDGKDARKLFENAELSGENSKLRKLEFSFFDWVDTCGGDDRAEERWVAHIDTSDTSDDAQGDNARAKTIMKQMRDRGNQTTYFLFCFRKAMQNSSSSGLGKKKHALQIAKYEWRRMLRDRLVAAVLSGHAPLAMSELDALIVGIRLWSGCSWA